jgi:acetate---CoA ligase (ADP-forming)
MESVINKYFYPESLCIVGASGKKGNLGYELTSCVKTYGYTGKLFLVNPKTEEILGIKCHPSVPEIKEDIDLAIVMVPKQFVGETLKQLLDKKVTSIILITAGFKETGKEGANKEAQIAELVKLHGGRLVGPNCMGIINTFDSVKLNATFVAEKPEPGSMAFLSQSGAIGAAVLNSLRETDIRFGHFISVGNKADMSENDFIDYWQNDKNINVVTLYLESFADGKKFIQKFIENKITKPVIILKGGRTAGGMKAASSHTGALGSSDKVVDSVLKQFNIIRTNDLNELFNTAKGFENFPLPEGKRIAVITNAGGPAILAVDSIEKNGLKLAEISEDTKKKLREIVHPEGSVNNPVDLLPGGTAENYHDSIELLLKDKNVDAVISVFVEPIMVKALPVIELINSIKSEKPLLQAVMPLPEFWNEYRKNSKYKIPLFRNPEDPAVVISNMFNFKQKKILQKRLSPNAKNKLIINNTAGFLGSEKIFELVNKYDLPAVQSFYHKSEELKKIEIPFPVVLKASGEGIVHKTELNAVRLNIKSKSELIKELEAMTNDFKNKNVNIESFLIQPFIKTRHEVLIGGFRDNDFGPMVMFGSGGKYVEVFEDTAMCSAYLNENDIDEMISSTKMGKILEGVRGEARADIKKIKNVIKSVARMMLDNEFIAECDLNPLIVDENNNLFAVDIRIKTG